MFLEIKNIIKKYNNMLALDDVSFNVKEKEIISILGPSGCGKTTILNTIGGFTKVDRGNIILDNIDITDLDPEDREVATVFQSYGLFPHKSVLDNIIYGLKFKGYGKKDAVTEGKKMLEILNLLGYENKKVTQLSGGEQQRVALGRALIVKPKLLLLDEPFSNLDTNLKSSMRDELLRIRDIFNITMIFVTHDQEDAFAIADRVIIMNKGKVEQIDTSRNIYENPKSKFVLNFVGSSNIIDNKFVRPENILLVNKGYDALVIDKNYKGAFIEYIIDCNEKYYKMLRLNNEKELNIGDKIQVEMEKRQI